MSSNTPRRLRVGVLGATGLVGQLFVEYLVRHPWFELAMVSGSQRTAGQRYGDAIDWLGQSELPEGIRLMTISESVPTAGLDFVLSALTKEAALVIEPLFAEAGIPVISNASAFRLHRDTPLLIPEVNGNHLSIVKPNAAGGFIVASPNCSTIGLASALAPLNKTFGLEHVHVTTLQALSGAGIPGVASLHSTANVIPFIGGEEDKLETEPQKILGHVADRVITNNQFLVSAQCNRVPVVDGHTCSVSVKLRQPATLDEIRDAIVLFENELDGIELPNKPSRFIRLYDSDNHPQPRLHVERDAGMSIGIGRLRSCPINDVRMTVLVHNTKRGAAGNALLTAELATVKGLFKKQDGEVPAMFSSELPSSRV